MKYRTWFYYRLWRLAGRRPTLHAQSIDLPKLMRLARDLKRGTCWIEADNFPAHRGGFLL